MTTPAPQPPTPQSNGQPKIRRRQVLITISALLAFGLLIIGALYVSDPHRKPTPKQKSAQDVIKDFRTPAKAVDPSGVWITESEVKLRQLDKSKTDMQQQINDLRAQLQDRNQRRATEATAASRPLPGDDRPEPLPSLASKVPPTVRQPTPQPGYPATPVPPPPQAMRTAFASGSAANSGPISSIVEVSLNADSNKAGAASKSVVAKDGKPDVKIDTIEDTIPAGAFTSAVLLNGVDAPTGGLAKTNPIPVLLHLLDNGTLPNHFKSRVKDCFVTGAGFGDLSAERAYFRLETLSCVMHDGEIVDATIDGYIAGEDGKNGMRGLVVNKQGVLIARALFAGLFSGMGKAIAQSYASTATSALGTVSTVSPSDIARVGAATGVGNAFEKVADFYIARANDLYPVIEINSARRGDVILKKKVGLGPAFATAWSDDN